MSFSLKNFIMDALRDSVGRTPDYKVRLSALDWHKNGVLSESDLAEIEMLIDEKNTPKEMPNIE